MVEIVLDYLNDDSSSLRVDAFSIMVLRVWPWVKQLDARTKWQDGLA